MEAEVQPAESHPASDEIAQWAIIAARAADDKLAMNTMVLDVAEIVSITDVFLITAGSNPRMVRAIANNIEAEVVKAGGPKALRTEGNDTFEWVLMDFGGFICHIFDEDHRAYYELERLWGDRPRIEWRDPNAPRERSADLGAAAGDESEEE